MSIAARTGVIAASRRRAGGGTPVVLGYDTHSPNNLGLIDGGMFSSEFTLAAAGTLTELHAWVYGGSTSWQAIVHLYSNVSSLPSARLAYTSPLSILGNSTDQHISQTGFAVALAAGTYWLGICSSGGSPAPTCKGESSGGHHERYTSGASFNPPPNPWGSSTQSGTRIYNCWGIVLI